MFKSRYILPLIILSVFLRPGHATYSQSQDTTVIKQIDSLIKQSKEHIYVNIDSAFYYSRLALRLSKKVNYYGGLEKSNQRIGFAYLIQGKEDSAKIYLNRSIHYAKMINDYGSLANSYNNLGRFYDDLMQYDSAEVYYNKAKRYFEQIDDSSGIGAYYLNMGRVYAKRTKIEKSYQYIIKSELIASQIKDSSLLAYVYFTMADDFYDAHRFKKANEYYNKAIILFQKFNDIPALAKTEIMLAKLYGRRGIYDKTIGHINKAIKYYNKIKNEEGKVKALIQKAKFLLDKKKYSQFEKVFALVKENPHLTIFDRQWLLYLSAKLDFVEGRYITGKNKLLHSLQLNSSFKSEYELGRRTYILLYVFSKRLDQPREEFKYYQKFTFFSYRKNCEIVARKMINMERLQELELKKLELKKLKSAEKIKTLEMEKQEIINKAFYIGSLILITILLIILYQLKKIKKLNLSLEKLNRERESFYRIFSHDVKNSIGAVLSFSEMLVTMQNELTKKEITEVVKSINKGANSAYSLLQNLLEWLTEKKEGNEFVKKKLNLKQLVDDGVSSLTTSMLHKQINCKVEVDENIFVKADQNSIVTVIRNLCSNAIKFSNENSEIKIYARLINNSFAEITVEDSGVGIPHDRLEWIFSETKITTTRGTQNEKGTGLGLPLVKKYVEKNGGKIKVESVPDKGSKFIFTIPLFSD